MASSSRPTFSEVEFLAATASIATTPAAAVTVATNAGWLQRLVATPGGTTTGTISVAVAINGGSDITGGKWQSQQHGRADWRHASTCRTAGDG